MKSAFSGAAALALIAISAPLAAQEAGNSETTPDSYEGTVFDGDWLTVGIGGAYSTSYRGSDDYVFSPIPLIQGSFGGVSFNPRPAGLALDFIPDEDGQIAFSAGIAAKMNRNRASQIKDPVVKLYGEKDTAIEVGPTFGVKFPGLLNPYDSLSFNVDALWDVAGAHKGMTVSPSVAYFTPLSRGVAVSLSLSANHVDDDYADYYYSVPVLNTLLPADTLPGYQAKGGFESMGVNLLVGYDLDGNVTNGGAALFAIGGYSRLLNDAKRTPFTSIRGSADQFFVGAGIGYTF
ncbi:MipA/OmpV family protein [Qipengyuania marisflavi]|uniref:MipA/OmpV family protein n=1 Tax=Qipengyuania marisflavi TaxID=2486356 RepID=A0A5S3P3J1_9SPHN|nr:MipA/OmpV family protein [Qipengyuania marisflavi]TMM47323.1 MipA/OmpV family protein [Qipengyuania marisflavi]